MKDVHYLYDHLHHSHTPVCWDTTNYLSHDCVTTHIACPSGEHLKCSGMRLLKHFGRSYIYVHTFFVLISFSRI
jgi:hypothetical protein